MSHYQSLHLTNKNLVIVEMLYSTFMWARTCGSPDNKVKYIFALCSATLRLIVLIDVDVIFGTFRLTF